MVCAAEMVQNYCRKVPICGTVKLKKQNTQKFKVFCQCFIYYFGLYDLIHQFKRENEIVNVDCIRLNETCYHVQIRLINSHPILVIHSELI